MMGYQNNICTVCGGQLDKAYYLSEGYSSIVFIHKCRLDGTLKEERKLMVCQDCGLIYARKGERDD